MNRFRWLRWAAALLMMGTAVSAALYARSIRVPVSPAVSSAPSSAMATLAPAFPENTDPAVYEANADQSSFLPENAQVCLPVNGARVTDEYRPDSLRWNETLGQYSTHEGLDLYAPKGAAVCAITDGVISEVYDDALLGRVVEIQHDGKLLTRYANLTGLRLVSPGQNVRCGETIDSVGGTAALEIGMESHLHLECEVSGRKIDPALLLQCAK